MAGFVVKLFCGRIESPTGFKDVWVRPNSFGY